MQYLKDEYIRPDTTVPGLIEARERLEYLRMSDKERRVYDNYVYNLGRDTDVMKTKLLEARIEGEKQGREAGMAAGMAAGLAEGLEAGRAEGLEAGRAEGLEAGRAEGLEAGRAEGILSIARKMKARGKSIEEIAEMTDLTVEEIEAL